MSCQFSVYFSRRRERKRKNATFIPLITNLNFLCEVVSEKSFNRKTDNGMSQSRIFHAKLPGIFCFRIVKDIFFLRIPLLMLVETIGYNTRRSILTLVRIKFENAVENIDFPLNFRTCLNIGVVTYRFIYFKFQRTVLEISFIFFIMKTMLTTKILYPSTCTLEDLTDAKAAAIAVVQWTGKGVDWSNLSFTQKEEGDYKKIEKCIK